MNPVEQAGLRDTVSLQVMAFDRYAVGSDLYVHRLTITDTQTVDLLIDALDADLFGGCVVECIPEHELHFHLKDGTVQTYGYSCGGASFLRGKQDFRQGVDYDPPERFDVLIQEQLALHPPAPVETSINLLDEAGLESAVGLEVSLLHTRSVSQGDTTVAEVSFEHLVTITDAVALGQLVDSLDTTLDLLPRTECVPEYVLRFKLGDGTLHDISYGCGDRDAPVLRGTLPFWRDMDLRPPVEFKRLFEEQLNRAAN